MQNKPALDNSSAERVEKLLALDPKRYEHWKFYEARADRLGERLWAVGIWLMTILAGTLSLPFVAGFIKPASATFPIQITQPIPVAALSLFGLLFCAYAYAALRDLREHIESNWKKANYILDGAGSVSWRGRKSHGWHVLLGVGIMAFTAFAIMFWASLKDLGA